MSGFVVEVDGVHAAAQFVTALTEDVQDRLRRVDAVAEDVFVSGWSGTAAAAYQEAWDEWRGAAGAVLGALSDIGDALTRTAADYAVREYATVGGFERIAP